jgi:hypothetical protein
MPIGKIEVADNAVGSLIDRKTMQAFPDAPDFIKCPRCDRLLPDFDGFGVVAHVGTPKDFPPPCGFCIHPSSDQGDDGKWTCGICRAVKGTEQWDAAKRVKQ